MLSLLDRIASSSCISLPRVWEREVQTSRLPDQRQASDLAVSLNHVRRWRVTLDVHCVTVSGRKGAYYRFGRLEKEH
jgi:hypothetical protein